MIGVSLVVPSIWAPTWRETTFATERGEPIREQLRWSWGRVEDFGADAGQLQDAGNRLGAAVLVALLLLALTAATRWLIGRGPWADLGGPVGLGLVAGRLLGSVAERSGRGVPQSIPGLVSVSGSTVVGVLESVGALALLGAVVLMVSELVRSGTASGRVPWARAVPRFDIQRRDLPPPEAPSRTRPRAAAGDFEPWNTQSGSLSSPEVGFSDDEGR